MSRKQQRVTGRGRDSGAARAFFGELGLGLLAIPVQALGLLLVAVFFQVAAENSVGVWEAVVAFAVALAAAAVGLLLVSWVAALLVAPAAAGWLGIFSGRMPLEFGPGRRNGSRALANLLLLAMGLPLGLLLFRHGVREGEMNWAIEGLFLAASAGVLGLLPAVPRLYFLVRGRRRAPEAVQSEQVVFFLAAATLGIGLSLALSFGITEGRPPLSDRPMRPGLWHNGCVDPAAAICPDTLTLMLPGDEPGRYHVEQRGTCGRLQIAAADGQDAGKLREVPWMELYRAKVNTYDKVNDIRLRVLELRAPARVRLTFAPGSGAASHCSFKVRYQLVPGGGR